MSKGIVFGGAHTITGDHLSLFVRGEQAIIVTMLVQNCLGEQLIRWKLSQLKELREAVDQAIKWLEAKQ
jgi:hypothetical protein